MLMNEELVAYFYFKHLSTHSSFKVRFKRIKFFNHSVSFLSLEHYPICKWYIFVWNQYPNITTKSFPRGAPVIIKQDLEVKTKTSLILSKMVHFWCNKKQNSQDFDLQPCCKSKSTRKQTLKYICLRHVRNPVYKLTTVATFDVKWTNNVMTSNVMMLDILLVLNLCARKQGLDH